LKVNNASVRRVFVFCVSEERSNVHSVRDKPSLSGFIAICELKIGEKIPKSFNLITIECKQVKFDKKITTRVTKTSDYKSHVPRAA
jgi:hypothetical protein